MLEELKTLRDLLTKVANAPMIDSHIALGEARRLVHRLYDTAYENEQAHEFLKKRHARSIY